MHGRTIARTKTRRAFAGSTMTEILRPLAQCMRLEEVTETLDAMLLDYRLSHSEDEVRQFQAYTVGLAEGFKLGFTAGYNKAKGRKPEHPGKRGATNTIDPWLVRLFAFLLCSNRLEGIALGNKAGEFLASMRAGMKRQGVDLKRDPLPSLKQLLGAYWRLRRQLPS